MPMGQPGLCSASAMRLASCLLPAAAPSGITALFSSLSPGIHVTKYFCPCLGVDTGGREKRGGAYDDFQSLVHGGPPYLLARRSISSQNTQGINYDQPTRSCQGQAMACLRRINIALSSTIATRAKNGLAGGTRRRESGSTVECKDAPQGSACAYINPVVNVVTDLDHAK
jgi:hypothetical protein